MISEACSYDTSAVLNRNPTTVSPAAVTGRNTIDGPCVGFVFWGFFWDDMIIQSYKVPIKNTTVCPAIQTRCAVSCAVPAWLPRNLGFDQILRQGLLRCPCASGRQDSAPQAKQQWEEWAAPQQQAWSAGSHFARPGRGEASRALPAFKTPQCACLISVSM